MKLDVKVDLNGLLKELDRTEKQIKRGIEQGLKVVASEVKQMEQKQIENTTGNGGYVPTGQLKRSVSIMPIDWSPYGASVTIRPMASYALFVEEGTGIYHPSGRQGGWFYPVGNDEYRFTLGMPPHYFVSDTFEFYKDKIPVMVKNEVLKCLR